MGLVPENRYDDRAVLEEINAQNGGAFVATRILRYTGTGYDVYTVEGGGTNFDVAMGVGYPICCTQAATWTIWRDVLKSPGITTPPGFTNDSTPEIAGMAVAGATVELYEGTTLLASGLADGAGVWSLSPAAPLPDGAHTFQAKAVSASGSSGLSNAVTLTIDTAPPTITVASPADGSTIATLTPEIVIQYTDAKTGIETSGVNPATLAVVVNGVDRTALFTVSGTEARFQPTGLETPPVFQTGANRIAVTLADCVSNAGAAQSAFTIETAPPPPMPPFHARLV